MSDTDGGAVSINQGGRPLKADPVLVVNWRQQRKASIRETAAHFGLSPATVKRYCQSYADAIPAARLRWQNERLDKELEQLEADHRAMLARIRLAHNLECGPQEWRISAAPNLIP